MQLVDVMDVMQESLLSPRHGVVSSVGGSLAVCVGHGSSSQR